MAEVMTYIKWCCDLDHKTQKAFLCNGSDDEKSSELEAHAQLLTHEPVPLLYNSQRHHPLRLDLISCIPSKLVNAKCQQPSASFALSAISSSCSRASVICVSTVIGLGQLPEAFPDN